MSHILPFLRLELTQGRVCSFVLPSAPSVVFCVTVVKCEIPLVGNEKEKPLDKSLAMNSISLKKLISRGPAARGVSHCKLPLIEKFKV